MRRTLPTHQAHSFAVDGELENVLRLAEQEVPLLPIHPFMFDSDVERVVATSNSWARSQTLCTPS
jgi:hypothetical protein